MVWREALMIGPVSIRPSDLGVTLEFMMLMENECRKVMMCDGRAAVVG
jgi:hypothetical protein